MLSLNKFLTSGFAGVSVTPSSGGFEGSRSAAEDLEMFVIWLYADKNQYSRVEMNINL